MRSATADDTAQDIAEMEWAAATSRRGLDLLDSAPETYQSVGAWRSPSCDKRRVGRGSASLRRTRARTRGGIII